MDSSIDDAIAKAKAQAVRLPVIINARKLTMSDLERGRRGLPVRSRQARDQVEQRRRHRCTSAAQTVKEAGNRRGDRADAPRHGA